MAAAVALLSLLAAISGALHVRAEYRGPRWQTYGFKPLTTGLILAVALVAPGPVPRSTGRSSSRASPAPWRATSS